MPMLIPSLFVMSASSSPSCSTRLSSPTHPSLRHPSRRRPRPRSTAKQRRVSGWKCRPTSSPAFLAGSRCRLPASFQREARRRSRSAAPEETTSSGLNSKTGHGMSAERATLVPQTTLPPLRAHPPLSSRPRARGGRSSRRGAYHQEHPKRTNQTPCMYLVYAARIGIHGVLQAVGGRGDGWWI